MRFWKNLSSGWQQAIFASIAGVLVAVIALGGWWAGAAIGLLFLLIIASVIAATFLNKDVDPASYESSLTRLGSALSTHVIDAHRDSNHKYLLLERTDLLDFSSGDFYSIRRIRGRNVSAGLSSFIPYVEHSEKKCSFFDCGIRAYDTLTRAELVVEPFNTQDQKSFAVPFKIFFPSSIPMGAEFDIVYTITLPDELHEIKDSDEIMSVFLGRINHGVDRLQFNVCLPFAPKCISVECSDRKSQPTAADGTLSYLASYQPKEWYHEALNIKWSAPPSMILLEVEKPKALLYAIRFKK